MAATAPGGDVTGRVLGGKYLVGAKLGSGGYGTVYSAMQHDLGRPCAIKVLDGRVSDHDVARFEREARAAAALGHPHIVQVTDFSARPDEPPFLVMELLSGETLGSLMKRVGRVPAPRVAAIAQQILAALEAAHRAGIVHRDVKPANVFLVANTGMDDFVKLLDFGIAKVGGDATALTQSGAMLGSPAYMAPEQVRGVGVDPRTDIYSLGATMYHALSGRYPFDAPTVHALLYAIAESWPAALASLDASIDPRLVAVVERAMHKDPAARFQSAAEMRAALAPFVGGAGIAPTIAQPTMPVPMPMPTPAPRSSTGLIVGIIAGVVLLLLVAGGAALFFFVLRGGEPKPKAGVAPTATATAVSPSSPAAPSASFAAASTTSANATANATVSPKRPPPPLPRPKRIAYGGTEPKIYSGSYNGGFTSKASRPPFEAVMPRVKQCFAQTEFDAPDHRRTGWRMTMDATGAVTSVKMTQPRDPHPKLEACVSPILVAVKVPPSTKNTPGVIEIGMMAVTDNDDDLGPP